MEGDKVIVNSLEPLDDDLEDLLTTADLTRVFLIAALRDLGGIAVPPGTLILGKPTPRGKNAHCHLPVLELSH